MHRLALAALLALGACAPTIDPAAKASLDGWSAGIRPSDAVYADQAIAGAAPKVGQWAEYRDVDAGGMITRRTQKVVGEEGGAFWIENELESYSGTAVTKALIAMGDWSRPETMDIRRIISQPEGQQAQEMPAVFAQAMARPLIASFGTGAASGPVETVTVPAGRFEARKVTTSGLALPLLGSTAATSWINGAVPMAGVVRVEGANGSRSELIGFGDTGAVSAISDDVASLQ